MSMSTSVSVPSLDIGYPHTQNNSISKATSLPPEIMALIFSDACELIPGNIHGQRQLHPFTLGGVCKIWREIAWSTSELWGFVDIHLANGKCEEKYLLLEEWISRANGRDLDIFLEKLSDDHCCPPIHVMEVLVQHISQWHSLCLRLPHHWCVLLFKEWDRTGDLSRLTSFTYDNHLHSYELTTSLDLSGAANLSHVTLRGIRPPPFVVKFPVEQITSLSLLEGQFDSRHLLISFPNLTKAYLSEISPLPRHGFHFPVKHPKLHTLHITFQNLDLCGNLFSLKRLRIDICSGTDNSSSFLAGRIGKYLRMFVERSQCDLTHLCLDMTIMDAMTALIVPISIQNALEILEIINRSDQAPITSGDAFFQALHPAGDSDRPTLVPHLRVFTYDGPLTKSHLATLLEVMILRTRDECLVGKLELLRVRSTIPLGPEPLSPFESRLSLDYELRDSLAELVRHRVFEINIYDGGVSTANRVDLLYVAG